MVERLCEVTEACLRDDVISGPSKNIDQQMAELTLPRTNQRKVSRHSSLRSERNQSQGSQARAKGLDRSVRITFDK